MKKLSLKILRYIVGDEYGFCGEGNEQWYYTVSLAINLMLMWWLKPEIALTFTILAVVHYATVAIWGYFEFDMDGRTTLSWVYGIINLAVMLVAGFTNIKWALITAGITLVSLAMAPDCVGENVFVHNVKEKYHIQLLFHTIIFAALVTVTFMLPIETMWKLIIISAMMVLHPICDWIEGECIVVTEVTYDNFVKVKSQFEVKKKKK